MLFDFANVLVFALFGVIFVLLSLTLSRVFAPKAPGIRKGMPYECGEEPLGTPWIRFNSRYYIIALIFLIFDVEIALMYPCAAVFRDWVDQGLGRAAFMEIAAFVGILLCGLVYVWRKGDFEWIRKVEKREKPQDFENEKIRAAAGGT